MLPGGKGRVLVDSKNAEEAWPKVKAYYEKQYGIKFKERPKDQQILWLDEQMKKLSWSIQSHIASTGRNPQKYKA